jgi:hypothetical protein
MPPDQAWGIAEQMLGRVGLSDKLAAYPDNPADLSPPKIRITVGKFPGTANSKERLSMIV